MSRGEKGARRERVLDLGSWEEGKSKSPRSKVQSRRRSKDEGRETRAKKQNVRSAVAALWRDERSTSNVQRPEGAVRLRPSGSDCEAVDGGTSATVAEVQGLGSGILGLGGKGRSKADGGRGTMGERRAPKNKMFNPPSPRYGATRGKRSTFNVQRGGGHGVTRPTGAHTDDYPFFTPARD